MSRRLLALSVLLSCVAPAGVAKGQEKRPLSLEDYFRMEDVGSPVLSPDGRWVVFVRSRTLREENRGHSELWIVPADGSAEPRRLTSPSFNASSPRWSPDGSLLGFSSSRTLPGEGRESWWFLRMDGLPGEAFQIRGVDASPLFSPGGDWIAMTRPTPPESVDGRTPHPVQSRERTEFEEEVLRRFDGRDFDWMGYRFDRQGYLPDPRNPHATPPRELYLVPAGGGEARRITEMGVHVQSVAWRPDGGALAFTADEHQRDERTYERSDLWTVAADGTLTRLTDDEMDYGNPAWSPDGQLIAVRGNAGLDVVIRERWDHGAPSDLYLFSVQGGEPRNLTEEWDLIPGAPAWDPQGRSLYFTAGVGGSSHLFRLDLASGEVTQITAGERMVAGVTFSKDFRRMAYEASDPTHPANVYAARPDGSGEAQLTSVNAELLAELALSVPENLHFPSADGTEIEGWILPPSAREGGAPGVMTHPLILTIHGGPHGAYGNSFMFEQQLLAGRGYYVLYTNPRASTGYGEAFRWGTWGGWGFKDYEDIMAGVDHVLERYPIDGTRMGVTGYSYGGYMTNWVITHTDRFAAAIAGAGISNWVSDYGTADIPRTKESEFYGPPWEEESLALLLRSSPIVHAKGVRTPTLFVHGESDHRVPIEEAEQMYTALQKQGVPARFIRYPESYHGGWTPWRLLHRYWASLGWWEEWLGERR
ncbi:MAG: S9 family peptidase [Longimicrobiales bacterium]